MVRDAAATVADHKSEANIRVGRPTLALLSDNQDFGLRCAASHAEDHTDGGTYTSLVYVETRSGE